MVDLTDTVNHNAIVNDIYDINVTNVNEVKTILEHVRPWVRASIVWLNSSCDTKQVT